MTIAVHITDRMLDAITPYVPETTLPVFHHDVKKISAYLLEVIAPYVAWEMLVDEIAERMMTRGARPNGQHTNMLKGLLARTSKSLAVVQVHPALRGRAKAGDALRDGVFPAWSQPPDGFGKIWSPTPTDGEFRLLKPRMDRDPQLGPYTMWDQFGHGRTHWCYDPEVHVAISESRALPELRPVLQPLGRAPAMHRRRDQPTG